LIEATVTRPQSRRAPGPGLRLAEVAPGASARPELEAFIAAAFDRGHGATVTSFMPTLLSLRDGTGHLRGVVGVRAAASEPLYLEQYLQRPVESAIAATVGRPVQRREVVEIGNLAGGNCRAAMRMVALLPTYLLTRDYRWIVFTATSAVRGILQGCGAPLVELARADAARVSVRGDQWGRYYEQDPRVLAGYLPMSRWIPVFGGASGER
jgi:hypothetical protein